MLNNRKLMMQIVQNKEEKFMVIGLIMIPKKKFF